MKFYIAKHPALKINLSKVVKYLKTKCEFVEFEELTVSFSINEVEIAHPYTHDHYNSKIKKKLQPGEYIILLTGVPYNNNYFYNEKEGLVILSFFAWKYFTSLPKENGLVYFICAMLTQEAIPTLQIEHAKKLGCINDFLADKTRVDKGMKKGVWCQECKIYLKSQKLTEKQSNILKDQATLLRELSEFSKEDTSILGIKSSEPYPMPNFPVNKAVKTKAPSNINGASVFISYSHRDDKERIRLENHLKILQRSGMISMWTDRKINAGDEWKNMIDKNLNSSQIILLLISNNFIASDYCYDIEMKTALKRHKKKEAIVIPIILSSCMWQVGPFAKLQALPQDGKPIQTFTRKDDAYTFVAKAIWKIIQDNYK